MKKILSIAILIMFTFFLGCDSKDKTKQDGAATEVSLFYCPMHPNVTSDKPGVCPICHMDLVLKAASSMSVGELENILELSEQKEILANVSTVEVKKEMIEKIIDAYSVLQIPESNRKIISARFNGRIEKLFVNETGLRINKGTVLFEYYSPQVIQAQNDFLLAMSGNQESVRNNFSSNLYEASKKKLQLLGFTDEQIAELASTQKINFTVKFHSPISGTILTKNIQEGVYVNEGSQFYEVVDLSRLWVVSEIFESDVRFIKNGNRIEFIPQNSNGEKYSGTINLIYPIVDAATRTISVRSQVDNSRNKLSPNMYGNVIFKSSLGLGLTIPIEAVLHTGKRNVVWKSLGEGKFKLREVQLGIKFDNKYQIVSGLNEGDRVASSGGFLIDSESQLRGITAGHEHSGNEVDDESKSTENKINDQAPATSKKIEGTNIFNEVCPIMGGTISTKLPTVTYKGKIYGFCCKGCDKKFAENPEKYLKNLSADGKKFIGE